VPASKTKKCKRRGEGAPIAEGMQLSGHWVDFRVCGEAVLEVAPKRKKTE
jgi:hypothetical protein